MKLSISLSDEDLAALDAYVERSGLHTRSAGIQHAIRHLRHPGLEDDYRNAWTQWAESGEEERWEQATGPYRSA